MGHGEEIIFGNSKFTETIKRIVIGAVCILVACLLIPIFIARKSAETWFQVGSYEAYALSTIPHKMKNLFDSKGLYGLLLNPDICPSGDQYNKLVFDAN